MDDAPPPSAQPADSISGDIIDAVYEVALDPSRYGELVEMWHRELILAANRAPADPANDPLADHFARATTILERVHKDDWQTQVRAPLPMPELLLSPQGRVLEANQGAVALLSASAGKTLQELDLTVTARDLLSGVVAQLANRPPANQTLEARVVRLNRAGDDRPLVVLLTPSQQGTSAGAILRCAEIVWPDSLGPLLVRAFDLTGAETDIVKALVAGENSATIATTRGTSRETVRTQIRELLAKTGTHSQLELIRMTIGFSMMAQQAEARSSGSKQPTTASTGTPSAAPTTISQQTLVNVASDRSLELLQYGDTSLPPTLVFHDEVIGDAFLLPLLKHNPDMHFIVPVRYGYGQTDLLDNNDMLARVGQSIDDLIKALDTADITGQASAMPVLAQGNGIYFACKFVEAQAGRCSSITAISPSLPRTSDDLSDATRYATFLSSMAFLAPSMLRFAVQAGFAMYARSGTRRFLQTVYGSVPADQAVIDNPEYLRDLEHGGRLTLAQGYRGLLHDEQAMAQDWTDLVTHLPIPIRLIMSSNESAARKERAERLQSLTTNSGTIRIVETSNARFLLAFTDPELVLATLASAHNHTPRDAERA